VGTVDVWGGIVAGVLFWLNFFPHIPVSELMSIIFSPYIWPPNRIPPNLSIHTLFPFNYDNSGSGAHSTRSTISCYNRAGYHFPVEGLGCSLGQQGRAQRGEGEVAIDIRTGCSSVDTE
jgi:hypothetical protein